MTEKRSLALISALAFGCVALVAIPSLAQNLEEIETRQQLMKDNGKAAKAAGAMLKGETAFDAARATEIFTAMHEVAVKFGDHFPEDSKTGGDTEAAPAIWEKPDEWQAALTKYEEDTASAMNASVADLDGFKQQFGTVAQNCKSCHEEFRIDTN